jgi:hypothetical protein
MFHTHFAIDASINQAVFLTLLKGESRLVTVHGLTGRAL